jgi:hypothetical protein
MMIMSPLLTVAIVTVSARAEPAPTRRAPIAAAVRIRVRISASLLSQTFAHLMGKCSIRLPDLSSSNRSFGDDSTPPRRPSARSERIGPQIEDASRRGLVGDQA